MSDAVIIAIASGALAFLGIMVNGLVAFFVARLNIQGAAAAKEVGEVKVKAQETAEIVKTVKTNLETSNTRADKKLEEIKKVSNDVHTLVNSAMKAQLKINVIALRRIAMITKKKGDIDAAKAAETLLAEHEKQAKGASARTKRPRKS